VVLAHDAECFHQRHVIQTVTKINMILACRARRRHHQCILDHKLESQDGNNISLKSLLGISSCLTHARRGKTSGASAAYNSVLVVCCVLLRRSWSPAKGTYIRMNDAANKADCPDHREGVCSIKQQASHRTHRSRNEKVIRKEIQHSVIKEETGYRRLQVELVSV
jgi:hypothetical protein